MGGFVAWLSQPTEAEKLFDAQVERLLALRVPHGICIRLSSDHFKTKVLPLRKLVKDLDCSKRGRSKIPFLIVLPNSFFPIPRQLFRLKIYDADCGVDLRSKDLIPLLDGAIPKFPYLIFDVDTGISTQGKPINECSEIIRKDGRSCLTLEEGIALLTHFPLLLRNGNRLVCAGHALGKSYFTGFMYSSKTGLLLTGFSKTSTRQVLSFTSCAGRFIA